MSRDLNLILIGAVIALTSSIVTALVQHLLALRAEKLKRKWDDERKQSDTFRSTLLQTDPALTSIKEKILRRKSWMPPLSFEDMNNGDDRKVFIVALRELGAQLKWKDQEIESVVQAVEQYFAKNKS